jgi:putative toxin-antitoxin system antitoxin component (TIGR02293 family)
MGIAFLRNATADPLPRGAARSSVGSFGGDFVIRVDDAPVLVVEARADRTFARFSDANGHRGRNADFRNNLISPPSAALIEKAVERGLPRQALRHVAEWLVGGDKAKASALEWGVVPKTTLERRETQLSPQESERTERVARLFVHARRALGTEAEARLFMMEPHPELDQRSPVDAARTDLGARRAEQILNALEYGLAL